MKSPHAQFERRAGDGAEFFLEQVAHKILSGRGATPHSHRSGQGLGSRTMDANLKNNKW
jgi:hypothetical protein